MEPIKFKPIYQERVWGGRTLASLYNRELPDGTTPFGESWELTDREHEQSVVAGGSYDGKTLNELWTKHRDEVFGSLLPDSERFPLLIKILDARSDLSIQVHPPKAIADELGGEPKTEMWYIADCDDDANLYVGLKEGVTKQDFEAAIEQGTVDEVVHAIQPKPGESIFIESGRLHAIGAGFLIFEIQQNSDTTYRVFDWNRMGLDGKPRQLHVDESMACIDFEDFTPEMDQPDGTTISNCEHFKVDKLSLSEGAAFNNANPQRFSIVSVVNGSVRSASGATFSKGDFFILPAKATQMKACEDSTVLLTSIPV